MRGAVVGTSGSRLALQGHGIGLRALLLSECSRFYRSTVLPAVVVAA